MLIFLCFLSSAVKIEVSLGVEDKKKVKIK